jgi:hypothetical protein
MWSIEYRPGYYIQGYCDRDECTASHSPSGYGHDWIKTCKSSHAAKIAVTKHMKGLSCGN